MQHTRPRVAPKLSRPYRPIYDNVWQRRARRLRWRRWDYLAQRERLDAVRQLQRR